MTTANTVSKFSKTFGFRSLGLPEFTANPRTTVAGILPVVSYGGNTSNYAINYNTITFKSTDGSLVLNDQIPGDYTLTYSNYGILTNGANVAQYFSPQPRDRVFVLNSTKQTGSNNAVFVDQSVNNFTIARTGEVSSSSVSPYVADLSANFTGSGNIVTVASSSDFALSNRDFTFETWVKPTNNSFYLVKSQNDYEFNLGYNLDNDNQGIVLGGISNIVSINLSGNIVSSSWGKNIKFLYQTLDEVTNYEITGINSELIGFGNLTGNLNLISTEKLIYKSITDNWQDAKYYIDAINGSDSNSGTSISDAWQTYNHAYSQTVNITTPVMLIFYPGTYNVTSITIDSFLQTLFYDNGYQRSFVCNPRTAIFNWVANSSGRDCPMAELRNSESKIYGATILRNNNGRTTNYEVAMFRGFGAKGYYYNCVFREVNPNGNWSLHYDNNNNMPVVIDQCVFYTTKNALSPYSGGAGMSITNCIFTHDDSSSVVTTNTLFNTIVDGNTYESASATNQGVYYGEYSWVGNENDPTLKDYEQEFLLTPSSDMYYDQVEFTVNLTLSNSYIVTTNIILPEHFQFQTGANLELGDWNHIAVSRQNSNIRVYVNGVLGNVANISEYNYGESATSLVFGGITDKYFQGRLADTHFISNQAIYTDSVYTVPETRTIAQANTKLLAFGRSIENTSIFPDASTSNHVITASAGVTNVYDSPVWYDNYTREIGFGSAYFDGAGDYLSYPANSVMNFGTGDFTVEGWIYPITTPGDGAGIFAGSSGSGNPLLLAYRSDLGYWAFGRNFIAWDHNFGTQPPILNAWQHLAVSRSGTTLRLFFNGSLVNTATSSQAYSMAGGGTQGFNGGSGYLNGYIAGARATGAALYTSNFTPPTEPLTAVAGTSLLLNFDNPTVYDEIKNLAVSFAGGAGPTTAEKLNQKFSIDCTGTKYLRLSPTIQRVNMAGTDTWSLEFTFKNASIVSGTDVASWGNRPGLAPWVFYVDGTSLRFYSSSNNSSWNIASNLQVIGAMAVGTWYKIRLSRTAAGYSIYVDDSLVASAANTGNFYTPTTNYIIFGAAANAGLQSSIYVEGIRINNTGLEFQSEYISGQRNISELSSSRTHTYPNNYFSTKPTNPSILTYPDKKINSSIQPTTQQLNTGQIFTLQVNNIENKLQYIQTSSNLDLIEQTTINNDPALERNPRPAGQEVTIQPAALKRFWY